MGIKLHQKEKQKNRLALTDEYNMYVFALAGISEDVDEVCENVKTFIETGQVVANKDLHIPTIPCYHYWGNQKTGRKWILNFLQEIV